LAFILAFHSSLGFRAIALGTALGSLVNAGLLIAAFERRIGGLIRELVSGAIGKMVLTSAAMAAAAWLCATTLETRLAAGWGAHLITGRVPILVGVGLYGLGTWLLGVPECRQVAALPGRLMRRRT